MSSSLKSSWRISRQTVFGASRSVFILSLLLVSGFWILASLPAQAIIDTNQNGASDPWERHHNNGNLFTAFDPTADLDGDGWTNMQEAAAGTNPFDPNPPNGFIRPNIVHIPATYISGTNGDPVIFTPEAITLTWPTLAGKQYTLHYSPDLSERSWQPVEAPYIGNGNDTQYGIPLTQENGSSADKLFWRVAVGDIDTDGDTLTDFEERTIGSSPHLFDTDGDGINDLNDYNSGLDDSDSDGVPDKDLYSVVFELQHEHITMPYLVPYESYVRTDTVHRYFTYKDSNIYSVSNSPSYTDIASGQHVRTYTSLVNGSMTTDGQSVTSTVGTPFEDWKRTHQKTRSRDETYHYQPTVRTVVGPTITAKQFKFVTTDRTPWTMIKDNNVVRNGTEVITITDQNDLFDESTYPQFWNNHVKLRPWQIAEPYKCGPLGNLSMIRSIFGDTTAMEMIKNNYRSNNFDLSGTVSTPGRNFASYGNDSRLKTLRWRWIRFNPQSPFSYDYATPPATVSQSFRLLVSQHDFLAKYQGAGGQFEVDQTTKKGIVEIVCKANEGTTDWQSVPLSKFNPYKLEDPIVLENMDFSKVGYSHVWFSLLPIEVAVDADHDGKITFDGKDKTTIEKSFRFWVNDDVDKGNTVDINDYEEDDLNESAKDSEDQKLNFRRDLEDLTRIQLDFRNINDAFPTSDPTVELKVRIEVDAGTPVVNLYQHVETDGGREYLKDENTGYNQLQGIYGQELCQVTSATIAVPRRAWGTLPSNKVVHFLFEGAKEGDGKLIFELWKDGTKMCDLPPVHLSLKKAKDMYETWTVGDAQQPGAYGDDQPASVATKTSGLDLPVPETLEEKDYVLFIHGWNMYGWEKEAFASSMFKRMWHQGYKGRFGAFRWPTRYAFGLNGWDTSLVPEHYNYSEIRAWKSAAPLAGLINGLSGTFRDSAGESLVRCYAHSMGNIVTSEALRQQASVHTYISAQAAIPANVWNSTTPLLPFSGGLAGSPETPNIYGYYWQTGITSVPHQWQAEGRSSYMAPQYMPSSTRYINHYNSNDWALNDSHWQLNQKLKPQGNYFYDTTLFDLTWRFFHQPFAIPRTLNFPVDRYEVFSHAAEARSHATGAESLTGGMFNVGQSVNLDTVYNFGDKHKGHSAQFRSTIQKRWTYWEKVLDGMQIILPEYNAEN